MALFDKCNPLPRHLYISMFSIMFSELLEQLVIIMPWYLVPVYVPSSIIPEPPPKIEKELKKSNGYHESKLW